jgi:toxin ParE1/3/4
MAATVNWSQEAEDDFDAIVQYLERQSLTYANRWGDKLIDKLELLKQHPEIGRMVPEKQVRFIREVFVDDYRLMYSYENGIINLLAIKHMAALLGKL